MKNDSERCLARRVLMVLVVGFAGHVTAAPAQDATASKRAPAAASSKAAAILKASAAKTADGAAGFIIERVPAWVRPVAAEPPSGLAPSPLQVLLSDRQRRLESTGTVSFTHVVRQINDSTGLQNGAQIEIEFDPTYEKLALHQLTVWRGAQRIDKLDRKIVKLLHRETQLERQMVDGRITASIVVDDLRVGDRLEWAFSRRGDNPVFEGRYAEIEWTRAEAGPTGQFRLRYSWPVARTLHHRVNDPAITVDSHVEGAWNELEFRGRNVAQFRYDPLLPVAEYLKYEIEVSEFADWAAVGAWGERLFARAIQTSPAVDVRVAEIRAAHAEPDAQLLAALDFVQQDIRYFGTEIGADSHQPATADTVLAQRFGDCKDKVALFATLAKALGFEARPILVSTHYGSATRSRLASPLAFDHAIVGVMVDGRTVWLDGTRSLQGGPLAARESTGLGTGLRASAMAEPLQDLPSAREVLRAEVVDTFHFASLANAGTLESVTTFEGDAAEAVRGLRASADDAEFNKNLSGDTLLAYPALALESVSPIEPVPGRNAIRITARYRTGKFWSFPNMRALQSEVSLISLYGPLRLPDQTPRTEPLQRWQEGRYKHTVKLMIDEPVAIGINEERFDESNAQFELHIRSSSRPHELSVEGELVRLSDRLEPGDWLAHRDMLVKVFPKLTMVTAIPLSTQAELDIAMPSYKNFENRVRRGEVHVVTRNQVFFRTWLMYLDNQLATGRVPQNVRPDLQTERARQLNSLGRIDEAKAALDEAIAIDANHAAAHAALARNALYRRADTVAVDEATTALRLAPADGGSRFVRAWTRYLTGDFAGARAEFEQLAASRDDNERLYGPLWLYLATRHLGRDGAAALASLPPRAATPVWPNPVVRWFSGQSDFDTALAATQIEGRPDPGRLCELYFYAAERALLDGDSKKARELWKKSVATEVTEFAEHAMAKRELDRVPAN